MTSASRGQTMTVLLVAVVLTLSASSARADSAVDYSSSASPPIIETGLHYTVTARGNAPPAATVLRHDISWGDGTRTTFTLQPGRQRTITHVFADPGLYRMTWTVTDIGGGRFFPCKCNHYTNISVLRVGRGEQSVRGDRNPGKCSGTAFTPRKRDGRIQATFVFDCKNAGFYELDLRIMEEDRGPDDVAAEFGDIISVDENGYWTDTSDGNTRAQFSKILKGTCLGDGPGERSEFYARLRYRVRGSLEGPDSENSTWRTLDESENGSVRCEE